jgi:hypothetical protein
VNPATGWTGRAACLLQAALRLSNESFAERLGIAVRTVAAWHQKPDLRPRPEMQQLLDTALERASQSDQARFARILGLAGEPTARAEPKMEDTAGRAADAERRLCADANVRAALDWLDRHAGWEPGTSRRTVATRLARLDVRDLRDRSSRRDRVDRRRITEALAEYYGDPVRSHGPYSARIGGAGTVLTSLLTCPDWLDLDCPLVASRDRLTLTGGTPDDDLSLDKDAADRAAQRLAETLATGTRLVDMPLYRLLAIDVRKAAVAGTLGVTHFVRYALTMDLLEGELVEALVAGAPTMRGTLPLRDRYLPDIASVLGVADRLCAGGVLALCAIARPASPHRGEADYLLLVQERSGAVVNATHRLAVIPKGFHQPLADFSADAQIGATLRREMEEELFGRDDIDSTLGDRRRAEPMHPSRLSEPMRWLDERTDRSAAECTGLGLNLVSGNFEFASLILIEDEEFWFRFGGQLEANWESATLRQYSSLDRESLLDLVQDSAWSNEGLFALLQGLRRLGRIGGSRVNLPMIEWEVNR